MTPVTTIPLCSFPLGPEGEPCRKRAVAEYTVGRETYLRCKLHDGPNVRAKAEEVGASRKAIAA